MNRRQLVAAGRVKHNSANANGEDGYWLTDGSWRNTLSRNVATGSGGTAFSIFRNENVLTDNTATGNGEQGFGTTGAGNTFTGNVADHNVGFGFVDLAVPGANCYADNTCIGNGRGGSEQAGLCDDRTPDVTGTRRCCLEAVAATD